MSCRRLPVLSETAVTPRLHKRGCEAALSPFCETKNDDHREKIDRRRSRLLELNLNENEPPAERRLSMGNAISGLTNAQMADHYSNCIKLSAENKITMKNAFNLHLIDYMQTMMDKRDSEMQNFQVASCTLDASAKIYASRVDFIHTETYKVASGLNMKNEKNAKSPKNTNANKDGDDNNSPTPVKKRKVQRMRTIEQNLESLNLNKQEDDNSIDPLHQKLRLAFDEGGTAGLLLNTLSSADDACQLQFDSKMPAFSTRKNTTSHDVFDLTSISSAINKILDPNIKICPQFADFSFLNWNENENNGLHSSIHENFAFDPNKCTQLVSGELDENPEIDRENYDDFDSDPATQEDPNFENEDNPDAIIQRVNQQTNLMTALSAEPSEYSYFNVEFFRSWAGPERWQIAPLSKTSKTVQTKQKKELFIVKFDKELDESVEFQNSKKTNILSKRTLTTTWSRQKNILPLDLHYKPETLLKLFLKPALRITCKKTSLVVDDVVNQYDYENANDCDNYCPAPDNEHDASADLFSTKFGSFEDTSSTSTVLSNGIGDATLVQQPYKVAKIDIQYARKAKRIDVKRVKTGIWKIITTEKPNIPEDNDESLKFSSLYKDLPTQLSGSSLENMSVPIAFVCLLYLANEKNLNITSSGNLTDLFIKHSVQQQ